jgi:NAD(P)-dependent dehydrogenase (short-subunit alcohol dehydrogenase family)
MRIELIDQALGTNLRGPYILACEVARRLISVESPGRIVNISGSGAFSYAGNGAALYSITKAAVARMTEVLAVEWARYNINVSCIAPCAFNSEMMDGMQARIGDMSVHFPRKRMATRPNSIPRSSTSAPRPPISSPERSSRSTTVRAPARD